MEGITSVHRYPVAPCAHAWPFLPSRRSTDSRNHSDKTDSNPKLKEQIIMKTIKIALAALALAALPVALHASDACKKCCGDKCAACCKDKGKTCGKDCCKGE